MKKPYITKENGFKIKTVHFPGSEFQMSFICQPENQLSDKECIRQAIAKKTEVENKPLLGSGKDEREDFASD